jgi:pimeloyl-ACP methyl ester carboxylesterase
MEPVTAMTARARRRVHGKLKLRPSINLYCPRWLIYTHAIRMRALLLLWLMTLGGCASWLPAPVPMRAVDHQRPGARATCLMVFLPGRGDSAEGFHTHGFVDEVAKRGYSIDMVAADATLGYYARGVLSQRLADDVVLRRAALGYKELWLVGNSMGGLGSLLYAQQRPAGEITGVLALAPYLGSRSSLFDAIAADGGLLRWRAPEKSRRVNGDNYEPELWRWLQAVTTKREPGPELYLGYGNDDKLAHVDSLLAAALTKDHVYVAAGGHNWNTWRDLFSRFLDTGPLRDRCQ